MTAFGIPTAHRGVNFRSRLEARWSEMFTLLGWRWTYEPIDLDGYIPDFVLHFTAPVLVEVKPALSWDELRCEVEKGKIRGDGREVLLVGAAPMEVADSAAIGLLQELVEIDGVREDGGWSPAIASWCACRGAPHLGFFHADQSWRDRVCGHYEGSPDRADMLAVDAFWREAGNRVQWRAPTLARARRDERPEAVPAKQEDARVGAAARALREVLGEARQPMTWEALRVCAGVSRTLATLAIRRMLDAGEAVEVRQRSPRQRAWQIWTRARAQEAGIGVVEPAA